MSHTTDFEAGNVHSSSLQIIEDPSIETLLRAKQKSVMFGYHRLDNDVNQSHMKHRRTQHNKCI